MQQTQGRRLIIVALSVQLILILILGLRLRTLDQKIEALANALSGYIRNEQFKPTAVTYVPGEEFVLGNPEARLTMAVIYNFHCDHCRRFFTETLPRLQEDYISEGLVKLVFIDHPNPTFPDLFQYTEAVLCANDQGKYLEFARALVKAFGENREKDLLSVAATLEMDLMEFQSCLEAKAKTSRIEALLTLTEQLGVKGTPSIIIGNMLYPGLRSYNELQTIIDEKLGDC